MSQIHATLEQAQRLKNAGFDKKCAHTAHFESGLYLFDKVTICYNGVEIAETEALQTDFTELLLQLPTLVEIGLPEGMFVACFNGKYRINVHTPYSNVLVRNTSLSIFPTQGFQSELDARIEAWIWAKQNLPATE